MTCELCQNSRFPRVRRYDGVWVHSFPEPAGEVVCGHQVEPYRKLTEEDHVRMDAAEARANSPVTRQELRDAIEAVANRYGCCGTHDADLIRDAFRTLVKELI